VAIDRSQHWSVRHYERTQMVQLAYGLAIQRCEWGQKAPLAFEFVAAVSAELRLAVAMVPLQLSLEYQN